MGRDKQELVAAARIARVGGLQRTCTGPRVVPTALLSAPPPTVTPPSVVTAARGVKSGSTAQDATVAPQAKPASTEPSVPSVALAMCLLD